MRYFRSMPGGGPFLDNLSTSLFPGIPRRKVDILRVARHTSKDTVIIAIHPARRRLWLKSPRPAFLLPIARALPPALRLIGLLPRTRRLLWKFPHRAL